MFLKRCQFYQQTWLMAVLLFSLSCNAYAQTRDSPDLPVPPPPIEIPPQPEAPAPLPPPEELLPPPTQSPLESQPTVPGTIIVEQFQFNGNTAFNSDELSEVTEPFTGRPISFAELLQARSAVTKLYVDNGYITSGAFIPPQEVEDGVVTVEVVEGSLEAIEVEVDGRLAPAYIRDRLALAATKPLNVNRLVEALQLLQLNPLIENLSAELSAGTRPGTSLLEVAVEVARTFTLQANLNNNRSPIVGSFQRVAQIEEANLLGFGDSLGATYRNTDGSNDLEFAYVLPLNARNGTLSLSYRTVSSEVIEPPIGDIIEIDSDFDIYQLSIRQPLVQTPSQEIVLGITADVQESQTTLDDEPFPLTLGANDEGELRVASLRFLQEWTQRGQTQVIAARSQFSVGLDLLDATTNDEPPDSRYLSWRGQAQWVRLLAPDTLLIARADAQLADRALVQLEQFGLGGANSVRGYRQDITLADNGIFLSLEFRLPVLRVPSQEQVLQVAPFVDFGTVWNDSALVDADPDKLVSVGVGLNYQLGDRLSARIDWGIPLIEADSGDDTLQENGVYFSLTYRLF